MNTVSIICTGNEILYGRTADTNSGHIAALLFPLDLRIEAIMSVGDDRGSIVRAVRHCMEISDLVILTGGLGPTDDDNTIEALREIFHFNIVKDAPALERMEQFFMKLGMPMSSGDMKMAEVPDTARVLENMTGLAPGFIIREAAKTIISLPGVPGEMSVMMEKQVLPFISNEYNVSSRRSLTFRVVGMKESDINEGIASMNLDLATLDWGITAKDGIATLMMVQKSGREPDFVSIRELAGKIFSDRLLDDDCTRPEEEVLTLLRSGKLTLACAESCTGGLIARRITDIPGASEVFLGGVVAYGNPAKEKLLNVTSATLESRGAVSEETAAEMAAGVRSALSADIGISVTGIAGPGGGSEAKPVGTVCFGLAVAGGIRTVTRTIGGNRDWVRTRSALAALEMLRHYLLEQKSGRVV